MLIKGDVSFEFTTDYYCSSLRGFERGNMSVTAVAEQVMLLHHFVFTLS